MVLPAAGARSRAAGLGHQLRALRRLRLRRRGHEGAEGPDLQAACGSSSSSSARARGDQIAVLSGLKPGEEVVTSGVFKLRNGAAVQVNNKIQPGNNPAPEARGQLTEMKFTDLFVKRPVLAIVVNLVILIAGLQAIRSLWCASTRAATSRSSRVDGLRRRQRRPRARLHHDAARARDRERRRHRLPRVVERPGRQHDHGPPEAQLRHERGAHAGPGEGRAGPQRPAARGGGARHRARDGGHRVRRRCTSGSRRRTSTRTRSPTT